MTKKSESSNDSELSRSGWVRNQLLHKPDITLEELQSAYEKSCRPKKEQPKDQQVIYQARSQLMKRWEWASLDEIPHTTDGKTVSLAGMVRRYIDMFGAEGGYEHAVQYFATDGLELKAATWHNAKSYLRSVQTQPDANQEAGPRAGKPEETITDGRRRGRRKKSKGRKSRRDREAATEDSPLGRYQQIEHDLDQIIQVAESLKNWQLVDELRNARRRAGAGILQHS